MDQVSVNVQQNCTIELLVHDMCLEHLVVKGLRGSCCTRHVELLSPEPVCACVEVFCVFLGFCTVCSGYRWQRGTQLRNEDILSGGTMVCWLCLGQKTTHDDGMVRIVSRRK